MAKNPWFEVEARMPLENMDVLVLHDGGSTHSVGYFSSFLKEWVSADCDAELEDVTHWQMLTFPKGE